MTDRNGVQHLAVKSEDDVLDNLPVLNVHTSDLIEGAGCLAVVRVELGDDGERLGGVHDIVVTVVAVVADTVRVDAAARLVADAGRPTIGASTFIKASDVAGVWRELCGTGVGLL